MTHGGRLFLRSTCMSESTGSAGDSLHDKPVKSRFPLLTD